VLKRIEEKDTSSGSDTFHVDQEWQNNAKEVSFISKIASILLRYDKKTVWSNVEKYILLRFYCNGQI